MAYKTGAGKVSGEKIISNTFESRWKYLPVCGRMDFMKIMKTGAVEMTARKVRFGGKKMDIHSIDAEDDQFAYRYDTQLLIDRRDKDLDEDEIADYITEHFEGNSLIAAGDEDLVKIHFHTNEPWKILEYCNSVGEIYDIVVEDMIRQTNGLKG